MIRTLAIMAKYPTPGRVKTRLCPPLRPDEAALLHRAFLSDIVCSLENISERRFLAVHPKENAELLANELGENLLAIPQEGEDLGERLLNVFVRCLGNGPVVAIGSDSPTLPNSYVKKAFELLLDNDVVLGPSADGGYYLIGLSKLHPDLFKNIRWGSEIVLQETLERASKIELNVALLPEWYDVDRPEDLRKLIGEASKGNYCTATSSVLDIVAGRLDK